MGNDHSSAATHSGGGGNRAPAGTKKVTAAGGGKATVNEHLARAEKTGVVNLSKANIKDIPPQVVQVRALKFTIFYNA